MAEYIEREAWISVDKRLPVGGDDSGAICENVNLLLDDGLVTCGWMNDITGKVYYLNSRDDVIIKAPISRVTHWMPLPQPPRPQTNADRIRSMTDEELADKLIDHGLVLEWYSSATEIKSIVYEPKDAKNKLLDWLKREVAENGTMGRVKYGRD